VSVIHRSESSKSSATIPQGIAAVQSDRRSRRTCLRLYSFQSFSVKTYVPGSFGSMMHAKLAVMTTRLTFGSEAADLSAFRVPWTAGLIKSLCGSVTLKWNGEA
jgi:hypothetical protein